LRDILERTGFDLGRRRPGAEGDASAHPICTVGALIFNADNQVLMIRTQKWSNLWGIPGGKIKSGEPSVEALRREIKEETGLDVGEIMFVMAQDCIRSREFYREAHFVLLNYTCRVEGRPAVKLNEEAQAFRWTAPAEALAMPLNQPTRALLERVLKTAA
jgi:ADP-ribose pyrophosphatase YjhB (NUDIX family)